VHPAHRHLIEGTAAGETQAKQACTARRVYAAASFSQGQVLKAVQHLQTRGDCQQVWLSGAVLVYIPQSQCSTVDQCKFPELPAVHSVVESTRQCNVTHKTKQNKKSSVCWSNIRRFSGIFFDLIFFDEGASA
jgi:hypothetical protein